MKIYYMEFGSKFVSTLPLSNILENSVVVLGVILGGGSLVR